MSKKVSRKSKSFADIDAGGGPLANIPGVSARNVGLGNLSDPELTFSGFQRPDVRGVAGTRNQNISDPVVPNKPKTRLVVIQVPRDKIVYIPVQINPPKPGKRRGGGGNTPSGAE